MEGVGWCFYDTKWLCYFPAGILGWLRFVPRIGRENPWKGLPAQTAACFPSWFCDSRRLAQLPLIPASLRGFLACDRAFLPEDFRTAVPPGGSYPCCSPAWVSNLPTFRFNVISSRRLLPHSSSKSGLPVRFYHGTQFSTLCPVLHASFIFMQVIICLISSSSVRPGALWRRGSHLIHPCIHST